MKIAYPVTDYIRASILTTEGDMIRRFGVDPTRIAKDANPGFLATSSDVSFPKFRDFIGNLNQYYKGVNLGSFPDFSPLALRDTGIFIGNSMRNSGGNQVISGIGFESSVIVFLACDSTDTLKNRSYGFDDGITKQCMIIYEDGTKNDLVTNMSISITRGALNHLQGYASVIGGDGFTIAWALAGVCSLTFIYLCLP